MTPPGGDTTYDVACQAQAGLTLIELEPVGPGDDALVGLHFPASGIPAQARALYHRALQRWMPTRTFAPSPILTVPLPAQGAPPPPIDLSQAFCATPRRCTCMITQYGL